MKVSIFRASRRSSSRADRSPGPRRRSARRSRRASKRVIGRPRNARRGSPPSRAGADADGGHEPHPVTSTRRSVIVAPRRSSSRPGSNSPWIKQGEHRDRRGARLTRRESGGIPGVFDRFATQSEAVSRDVIADQLPVCFVHGRLTPGRCRSALEPRLDESHRIADGLDPLRLVLGNVGAEVLSSAITSSTMSSESALRSFTKLASGVTSSGGTESCSQISSRDALVHRQLGGLRGPALLFLGVVRLAVLLNGSPRDARSRLGGAARARVLRLLRGPRR